jgi:hypothetical protein
MPDQVQTTLVSLREIMGSREFQRGVAEVRAGRPPRFDREDSWEYERGRQWAIAAPKSMPLKIGGRINPKAIDIFHKAQIP